MALDLAEVEILQRVAQGLSAFEFTYTHRRAMLDRNAALKKLQRRGYLRRGQGGRQGFIPPTLTSDGHILLIDNGLHPCPDKFRFVRIPCER